MEEKYSCSNDYIKYAGTHLGIELWNSPYLSSFPKINKILQDSLKASAATLLKIDLPKWWHALNFLISPKRNVFRILSSRRIRMRYAKLKNRYYNPQSSLWAEKYLITLEV